MIKGTAQASRDSKWHKRHTQKKAANAVFQRNARISGRSATLASIRAMNQSDNKFKEAQAREAQTKVGIKGWLRYTLKNIYRKIKSVFHSSHRVSPAS